MLETRTNPSAKLEKWSEIPMAGGAPKQHFNKPLLHFGTIVNEPFFSPYLPPPKGAMQQWGWFCQKEWLMQQKLKLPLYLRLGNKETVDHLEQKLSPR